MRSHSRLSSRVVAIAMTLALTMPAEIAAITNGFVDSTGEYANTGAFLVQRNSDGRIFPICTGTLIAPTVFLTAAHCTAFFEELEPLGFTAAVSFDGSIPFGALTDLSATDVIPATSAVTNPGYNQAQSDSGDIGVLILPAGSTAGITPAKLPTLNQLEEMRAKNGLKDATFDAVGYGLQDRHTGGGPPIFDDANPVPRMYAFSSFNALSPGYIRLSMNPSLGDGGTCFGDSGGPNFLTVNGERILMATTVTGDAVCRATNVDYRLDTASARTFLGDYVTLP